MSEVLACTDWADFAGVVGFFAFAISIVGLLAYLGGKD